MVTKALLLLVEWRASLDLCMGLLAGGPEGPPPGLLAGAPRDSGVSVGPLRGPRPSPRAPSTWECRTSAAIPSWDAQGPWGPYRGRLRLQSWRGPLGSSGGTGEESAKCSSAGGSGLGFPAAKGPPGGPPGAPKLRVFRGLVGPPWLVTSRS